MDLIARDGHFLVFIEVKYRKNSRAGDPSEAVNPKKQQRMIRAARVYLMKEHYSAETPVRFDVVSVLQNTIRVIKDAFWVS